MLSDKDLREIRKEGRYNNLSPTELIFLLVDDIFERKTLHTEEQRRSADRLRECIESKDA